MSDPVFLLAFGFGSGLAKKAPGTCGTLAAVPIYLILIQAGDLFYSLIMLLVSISGIWICGIAAKKLGVHDYGGIVWDEIAGYLITMWAIPFSWGAVIAGFVLFRLFDILKPWPIKTIDSKMSGGLGIMMDDVLAGIFAWVVLILLLRNGLL